MSENNVKTTWCSVWAQPDGPSTTCYLLGCYAVPDVTEPMTGVEQVLCHDAVHPERFVRKSTRATPADMPTTSFEGLMEKTQDWMERVAEKDCKIGIFLTFTECPPKNFITAFDRVTVLEWAKLTQRTDGPNAGRDASEDTLMTFEATMDQVRRIYSATMTRRTTVEDQILNDVLACGLDVCANGCGPATDKCDVLYALAQAAGGLTANVLRSADAGATWAATAADPFAADEDIAAGVCFPIGRSTNRLVVARGTTDAGNPAEIAYSDDAGATWTAVNVGSTNGEYALTGKSMFALNYYSIWLVTDLGNVYHSADGAVTWTDQNSPVTDDLRAVHFANANVGIACGGSTGASNVLIYTLDGGVHWNEVVIAGTDMFTCCICFHESKWWLGDEAGVVIQTLDAGANWRNITLATPSGQTAAGEVSDMQAWSEFVIWVSTCVTKTGPTYYGSVQRTFNGGADWEYWTTPAATATAAGLQALQVCGPNQAFAVGGVATTSMIVDVANP